MPNSSAGVGSHSSHGSMRTNSSTPPHHQQSSDHTRRNLSLRMNSLSTSGASDGLQSVYDIIKDIGETMGDVTMLERLRQAVHGVGLEELGLIGRATGKTIEYMHLYEDENVSMGIFCLPKNSRIPLHNHPGMSVVSRVLYGDLHVTSFDWNNSRAKIAAPVYNGVIHGNGGMSTHMLLPESHGNLHQFTALSDCAILDVLCPPYSSADGRDCTYYRVESVRPDGCVKLGEFNPNTKDLRIVTVEYPGRPSSEYLL